MFRIESFLSSRSFLSPQICKDRIFFLSNISGHISLYSMRLGGSIPEALLPPHIALQNPILMESPSFHVFPKLDQIVVMIDQDGDEKYQPMSISLTGGFPESIFGEPLKDFSCHLLNSDTQKNLIYLMAESHTEEKYYSFQGDLENRSLIKLAESRWGRYVDSVNSSHTKAILVEGYTIGDHVLYYWEKKTGTSSILYGVPIEQREDGQKAPLNSINSIHFTPKSNLLFITSLFSDKYGLGYLRFDSPQDILPVKIVGARHTGEGELVSLDHLSKKKYALQYNIDGCSWLYEGDFDEKALKVRLKVVICGEFPLTDGVLQSSFYDKQKKRYALSFSTATSPSQMYIVKNKKKIQHEQQTNEKVLGIPDQLLSAGEDASFMSFDGTRVSARLYLPSPDLGYANQRPLIYYMHGGPQGQERPDFAWFSMPLIQFLTLNGFAVFVPNVRGSTGYGLSYTKMVDHDWGGNDRLDHVYAMKEILPNDKRIDVNRAGVVGRSYGGYMSLILASRHPDLWSATVDMFGPYNLLTFMDRIPETWKPYFAISVGDPVKEKDLLEERSPVTYLENILSPLLVIQGKNDPRVVEKESYELVEKMRAIGKEVDYLMFDNEGHDVLKYENRVKCYNAITNFFNTHLKP